jgi:hypothetical protein
MRRVFFLLFVFASFSCEDPSPNILNTIQPDVSPRIAPSDTSPPATLLERDARLITQWDASPDAIADMSPPQICTPLDLREDCQIEGLLGPCGVGERNCNLTSWSQCAPINFPRIEVCDEIDNDCDGRLNESPPEAEAHNETLFRSCYTGPPGTSKEGTCASGISVCTEVSITTDGGVETYYDYGSCERQRLPAAEECDTLDNDCDGLSDEGVLNVCSECGPDPIEVCDGHHFDEDCDGLVDENLLNVCGECGDDPIEICDGLDNDCDGDMDEELLNACGQCGDVPRELCDFVDNDCDGNIDEDFADEVCACDHPDYVPQPEICNGADEDCDGFIDEGPDGGPLSKLCSTDLIANEVIIYDRREDGPEYVAGDCRLGGAFCERRRDAQGVIQYGYFDCQQEIRPHVERCNDEDDDCDGIADEDFLQGSVAVMMVVDVSGSMDMHELGAAFDATRNSVQRLFNNGALDVCYMLAVVGNDDMPDPYLSYPGDNCVPGIEDPPIVPIEDMANAVNTLRLQMQAGVVNQGGSTENTLDAIGRFFTDDRIDWDRDGINENILWNTNRPSAQIQGIENSWDVDLSQYTHRVVIVIGDEPAQGDEWNNHTAASAMAHANGMVFIIGTRQNIWSYQPLIDLGAVHSDGLDGFGGNNEQQIVDAVTEAIEEAACINNRQEEQGAQLLRPLNNYVFATADTTTTSSPYNYTIFPTGYLLASSYESFRQDPILRLCY